MDAMKIRYDSSKIIHQCRGLYCTYCGQSTRRKEFKIVAAEQDTTCKLCIKAIASENRKEEELKLKNEQREKRGKSSLGRGRS